MNTPISFGKIKSQRTALLTGDASNRITFGIIKAGKYERGVVTIGEFFMAEAGLIVGDKVDMIFHPEDNFCLIKKVGRDAPGFNLNKSGKNESRGSFSFTWEKPMPYHKGCVSMEAAKVMKDPEDARLCISFDLPCCFETFKKGVENGE